MMEKSTFNFPRNRQNDILLIPAIMKRLLSLKTVLRGMIKKLYKVLEAGATNASASRKLKRPSFMTMRMFYFLTIMIMAYGYNSKSNSVCKELQRAYVQQL
ncbi:MAG: hypothetical protein EXX96DRAFT_536022 [Benjaminiella poitrasii]|nr:MAG: hypothetical protein EXX96DRAFT_536022 [Benjaminiella poitrasii]